MAITLETTLKLFLGYPYSLLISGNHSSFFFFSFFEDDNLACFKTFFLLQCFIVSRIFCPPPKDFRGGVMFFTKAKMQW